MNLKEFDKVDQSIRTEILNKEYSQEREEIKYKMMKKFEEHSQLASEQERFFKPMDSSFSQYNLWKSSLFIPLQPQLKEQAQRKVKELEE